MPSSSSAPRLPGQPGAHRSVPGAPDPDPGDTDPIPDGISTAPSAGSAGSATRVPAPAAASSVPAAAAPSASRLSGRLRRLDRAVRPALAVYALTAIVHLVLLSAMTAPGGPGLRNRLLAWDGGLYVGIAADGYADALTYTPQGELTGSNLAFFPLYPLLIRALHGLTGLDHDLAAIVGAHLALVATLIIVHRLLERLYGRRTATIGIVLLAGAQPMAVSFFMGYSESLFLALAAGTLLAAHRRAWLTAGVLALFTGLTRPAAAAVVLALVVAAVLHLLRERRISWRPVAGVALGCVGTPAYLWWVGLRTGHLDAWFTVQKAGWGTHWDGGAAFFAFLGRTLAHSDGWIPVSTAVLLLALLCATVLAWRRDAWPPLVVYGTGIVIMTLGQSNYYHSKLRLLVPAVIFLVPAARALARAHRRTTVIVLTAATLFGCWYGAYMLTVWQYAI